MCVQTITLSHIRLYERIHLLMDWLIHWLVFLFLPVWWLPEIVWASAQTNLSLMTPSLLWCPADITQRLERTTFHPLAQLMQLQPLQVPSRGSYRKKTSQNPSGPPSETSGSGLQDFVHMWLITFYGYRSFSLFLYLYSAKHLMIELSAISLPSSLASKYVICFSLTLFLGGY